MRRTDVIVIGAGQAGLAASHELGRLRIAHVVLERGRIAERWRSERWDGLTLLTPNWMSRLPGQAYTGDDPDGFMSRPETIAFLDAYARRFAAPVEEESEVRALRRNDAAYLLETGRGAWQARAVILATGHCALPAVPAFAARLFPSIHQETPSGYRNPSALPPGGVLVVGAGASALQIAEELLAAGRRVMLSVGRHTRMLRSWRGRDIWRWMELAGVLEDRAEDQADIARARRQPSPQLIGGTPRRDIDLGTLHAVGVRILGRAIGAAGFVMHFWDNLAEATTGAQRPLESLLARIDPIADAAGAPPEPWPRPITGLPSSPPRLDLKAEGIGTVLWATGYRRDNAWLRIPGLTDATGEVRHQGGVTPSPGIYLLGMRFMRRRSSGFLGGVGPDATAIAAEAARHLAHTQGRAAA
jgi:putative flavoprotein involved in K+ transport